MRHFCARPTLIAALAIVGTIVPTIGSRGMGTLGERFVHADRPLLASSSADAGTAPLLRSADRLVEKEVLGSIDD